MSFQKKEIVEARVLPSNAGKPDGKNLNGMLQSKTQAATNVSHSSF